MREYPAVITERVLAINAHIPDAEIEQDIADTQREIVVRRRLGGDFHDDPNGTADRQAFVAFLRRLLRARKGIHEDDCSCGNCAEYRETLAAETQGALPPSPTEEP